MHPTNMLHFGSPVTAAARTATASWDGAPRPRKPLRTIGKCGRTDDIRQGHSKFGLCSSFWLSRTHEVRVLYLTLRRLGGLTDTCRSLAVEMAQASACR